MSWEAITGVFALLDSVLVALFVVWILTLKRDPTSAIAWSVTVIFLPFLGIFLFLIFGYQNIHRPLGRKIKHKQAYQRKNYSQDSGVEPKKDINRLAKIACGLGMASPTEGNHVHFYISGEQAYAEMLKSISQAKRYIHLEVFILRNDQTGRAFLNQLIEKAKQGVQVRVLYDAIGSIGLRSGLLKDLKNAGGQVVSFLSLFYLWHQFRINLRNHRKILIVDGKVAYTGGMNLGDEYAKVTKKYGRWRDTQLKIEGPAVAELQRLFAEDWNFAAKEDIDSFAEEIPSVGEGNVTIQVAWSGPDQEIKTIREIYLAAIFQANNRLWAATPYLVPDASLLDALCVAARSGCDVRVIVPYKPDKWIPFLAGRYYWGQLMKAGVKIYQYQPGFMHAKVLLIDDWASVGSVNLDCRSLFLNFEVTCFLESHLILRQLEGQFHRDFELSKLVTLSEWSRRPFAIKVLESGLRLLTPIL
ncbi:MAG: cardiolipin synthase [Gemmataceae bacterium]|jgi:cardiolipin synthase|nr:cardiolipin synthase [Gemmataceae bacterium]